MLSGTFKNNWPGEVFVYFVGVLADFLIYFEDFFCLPNKFRALMGKLASSLGCKRFSNVQRFIVITLEYLGD